MNICLLTTNPNSYDDRIFYKLARSLNKVADISVINPRVKGETINGIKIIGKSLDDQTKDSAWILDQLKNIKPDIIQVTEPLLLPPSVKYKSKNSTRIIYDPAEDWSALYREFSRKPIPIPQILGFGIRQFENWYLPKVDYFIASDDWLYDYYKNKGPGTLIYNYPNKDIFTIYDSMINRRPFSCVHHGQLRRERGLFLMIEAMKLVVEKYPDATLDLIGHFSYPTEEEECHRMVEEYDLLQNVNISSPIPHTEIPHRISQSAIGLLPFYNIDKFRNNIVIKMFEFSACKLPIVSFDLPPSRKYVDSVNCGICVEVDSHEALAKGIIQCFENKEEYELHSKNGYNAFINKNHWEAQEDELFNVYNRLLN